jgi:hypothetical protein
MISQVNQKITTGNLAATPAFMRKEMNDQKTVETGHNSLFSSRTGDNAIKKPPAKRMMDMAKKEAPP